MNNRRTDPAFGREDQVFGQVIADLGYEGYVSHEWRPTPGRDPLQSIAEAMSILDV
jgi:hypothetical protein